MRLCIAILAMASALGLASCGGTSPPHEARPSADAIARIAMQSLMRSPVCGGISYQNRDRKAARRRPKSDEDVASTQMPRPAACAGGGQGKKRRDGAPT